MSSSVAIGEQQFWRLKKYCKKRKLNQIAVINEAIDKYLELMEGTK